MCTVYINRECFILHTVHTIYHDCICFNYVMRFAKCTLHTKGSSRLVYYFQYFWTKLNYQLNLLPFTSYFKGQTGIFQREKCILESNRNRSRLPVFIFLLLFFFLTVPTDAFKLNIPQTLKHIILCCDHFHSSFYNALQCCSVPKARNVIVASLSTRVHSFDAPPLHYFKIKPQRQKEFMMQEFLCNLFIKLTELFVKQSYLILTIKCYIF